MTNNAPNWRSVAEGIRAQLTPGQRGLLDNIYRNPMLAAMSTNRAIMRHFGVSKNVGTLLAHNLGYDSWDSLKVAIAEEIDTRINAHRRLHSGASIPAYDPIRKLMADVEMLGIYNSERIINDVAGYVYHANHVVMNPDSVFYESCRIMADRFSAIGRRVTVLPANSRFEDSHINKDDLVLLFTHCSSDAMLDFAMRSHEHAHRVITFSNSPTYAACYHSHRIILVVSDNVDVQPALMMTMLGTILSIVKGKFIEKSIE